MEFESLKVIYSSQDNWDEIVNITFINNDNYLSFNSLSYEDEVNIELNDQTTFINVLKKDFSYTLLKDRLIIYLKNNVYESNLSESTFNIYISNIDLTKMDEALHALVCNYISP